MDELEIFLKSCPRTLSQDECDSQYARTDSERGMYLTNTERHATGTDPARH